MTDSLGRLVETTWRGAMIANPAAFVCGKPAETANAPVYSMHRIRQIFRAGSRGGFPACARLRILRGQGSVYSSLPGLTRQSILFDRLL
jgi:hypothetical protein